MISDKCFFLDNIERIKTICARAGSIQIEYQNKTLQIQSKTDNTPLTEVDLMSHEVIVQGLQELDTSIPIVSEEGFEEDVTFNNFWIVDPLDGTRNYINKGDNYCVNIGFICDNFPIFGAIYIPSKNEFFYGINGQGAHYVFNDKSQRLKAKNSVDRTVLTSSAINQKKLDMLNALIPNLEIEKISSAIKFGYIAKGFGNFYPRFGPTYEWDTAAGQCILEESGGKVVDSNLSRLSYNKNKQYLNKEFFAFSGDTSYWEGIITHLLQTS